MGNLEFPSNPTSYRRTGWQIFLVFLMGVNYLMDHNPRHVQYTKDQRAKRKAEKQRYKSGFVTKLPDDYGDHSDDTRPVSNTPPPVSPNGKEAYPYARQGLREDHGRPRPPTYTHKPASKRQMRDAWTRMRAVTRLPYEYVKRADRREKRVTFNRSVQWYIFDGDEESYDGDSEEDTLRH